MKFRALIAAASASVLVAALGAVPTQAASKNSPDSSEFTHVTTVAEGLATPLKVAFGADSSMLVAESFAGQLTKISASGERSSLYSAGGKEIGGVSYAGGTTYFFENSMGEEGQPDPNATAFLKSISPSGQVSTVADLAKYEAATNADGSTVYGVRDAADSCLAQAPYLQSHGEQFSHPYSSAPVGSSVYVGDAGANVILKVSANGKVSLVKALPAEPIKITASVQELAAQMGMVVPDCMLGLTYWAQPVPTDITVKGQWLYYTVLPGVPGESLSMGKVYRVNLESKKTQLVASHLSAPTGVAVDKNNQVYVTQLFGEGVAKLSHGKAVTVMPAVMAADIAIDGNRVAVTTKVLTESGELVTARLAR
ncbi:ScyD/ScyE family protein [Glutamicibacter sp.]|uniref:ScyD/ScyE family protein n=1 Tax=Glutamicibacter sp. TaxID=1931995 RepID=UPI0028BEE275|nr:ScyD/ScyE family protein [Glutamicibacter sp.]